MRFEKNKIFQLSDLERKFSFDFDNKDEMISNIGKYSTVWKVYDENGKVYAGKFYFFGNKRKVFSDELIKKIDKDKNTMVSSSRNHENFVAQKIYEIKPDWTPKPEGVFAVRLEGVKKDFYFPAFVNEYDETLEAKPKGLIEDLFQLKSLITRHFFFSPDATLLRNNLIDKNGKLELIDFGWWGYKRIINPFPKLEIFPDSELEKWNKKHFYFSKDLLKG
jgi:hypothetical protein